MASLSRKLRLFSVLTATALISLIAPAGADAAPGKIPNSYEVVHSGDVVVVPGSTSTAVKSCPAGKQPLGGGLSTNSDSVKMVESYPYIASSAAAGWVGTVANEGTDPVTFDVYAICAIIPSGVGYEIVSASSTGLATVNCPEGKKPFGGGLSTASIASVIETFPLGGGTDPIGWLAWVADGNQPVTVYAVCGFAPPQLKWTGVGRDTTENVATGAVVTSSITCPGKDQKMLSGGPYANGFGMRTIESYPSSTNNPKTWIATVTNVGDDSPFTIYAICAKVS
jgi:hypothetical protein